MMHKAHQLIFLALLQVHGILQHKDWEARTAAGYCLGLIAEHIQHMMQLFCRLWQADLLHTLVMRRLCSLCLPLIYSRS